MSTRKSVAVILGVGLLLSCAGTQLGLLETANNFDEFQGIPLAPLKTAAACRASLGTDKFAEGTELVGPGIRILNWNIKKGEEPNWQEDLQRFSQDKNLVLLQEAALSMQLPDQLQQVPFAAFSPGYVKGDDITGVVTFSDVEPVSRCRLSAVEPWLGTPKSTNITEYALSDSDNRLVVVNMHALNFSFGLLSYRMQLDAVSEALEGFHGAVLLSGDFNTWRRGRQNVLSDIVERLGLRPVVFENDYRERVFGRPLDHMYVRGLDVVEAQVFEVSSSDHNPMVVSFKLNAEHIVTVDPEL
ncbi:endonuclease/exonuclease/phosphatase family protein [Congregibacter brevis]|uniref:Endonuclease/exonuclease/phosphatase family protein n=1 Tax=Congregibacter brevis TaxID=3081201 RepID=A0ABZ0IIJ3_9GAMM|nr:endonuclease/exonuclease/phosphatase family protein [Congregibacter sp. IMCC45268]